VNSKLSILLLSLITTFFIACNGSNRDANVVVAKNGKLKIVCDESYKPVIDQQIEVFKSEYPKVDIEVLYKTEAECYAMLDKDSTTNLILVSKKPTKEEDKYYTNKFDRGVSYEAVAVDAVAVIAHPSFTETKLKFEELRDVILGKSSFGLNAIFDGKKETSIARYIRDSLVRADTMPNNVSAVEGNQAVIDFVSKNPKSLGFVGATWLANSNNSDQFADIKNVKIIAIQCQRRCPAYTYQKPYLYRVSTREYPLVRGLYYVLKNDYGGVGSNFAKWLTLERGQLIFNKGFMVGTFQTVHGVRDAEMEK
jgi:phosphate transport system substrate-binding protein